MKYRYLVYTMTALALAGCMTTAQSAAQTDQTNRYTITGDVSAAYRNGEFVVWVSGPKNTAGGAMSMAAATPASGGEGKQPSIKDSLNIVAEAPLVDGKFFLEGTVHSPRNVSFYVLNAISKDGRRMAPIKMQSFVLEPGNLTLVMDSRTKFVVEGGHYNDIVVNSWRLSPEYLELMDNYYRTVKSVEGETEEERRARVEKSSATFSEILGLEGRGRSQVALNHDDPLARKLTIQSTWLRGPWVTEATRELAEMVPDDPWVIRTLASEEQYAANRAKAAAIAVGTEIKDFEAETLDGEVVSISGAREGKEIVLVEFWASWCGPCRTEIPHMKQAYEDYGPNGFEIFSFTVDDEREDWVEASAAEELPWINAGMGLDHPATETYGVTGVPANFLVDAASGEIVAKNLRGHKLDEALEERLGKSDDES
jgi:thiol-disulfide isomerase/thioredoxin